MPARDTKPLVTVLMPSYNHGKYVRDAVESIFADTYRPLELVVVDDASSDDSPQILTELQKDAPIAFKLELMEENRGAPKAMNRALAKAEGEFICVCASDDMHIPGGLEKMVPILQADKSVQVVYGNGLIMEGETLTETEMLNDQSLAFVKDTPEGALKQLQTGDFPMWFQLGVSRASLVHAAGGWDDKRKADDGPRARRVYQYLTENKLNHAYIDVPYYIYRTHESNMHKDASKMRDHILDALESQFSEEERPQALARNLLRVVRVSLENGKVRDAVKTLHHLIDDVDDPELDALLAPLLMSLVKQSLTAQRDPASGQWSTGSPSLEEKIAAQKEKIAGQRERIDRYQAEIRSQREEIRSLKRSASWKIGRMWTKPFRLFHGASNNKESGA